MLENHLTIAEAAKRCGVSRQRMHILLRTYDVPRVYVSPRLTMVDIRELVARIPADRPSGKKRGIRH